MGIKADVAPRAPVQCGPAAPTRVRYIVLWLTVAAYMITYMDRVVISSAVPAIQKEFGFSMITIGWILSSFQWAYALFQIPGGWLGDRFGPRRALASIVIWWSLFTGATALAWSAGSMLVVRFLFGMGEAGAFPVATRSMSRWMLPAERGFAQGVTHAGSRMGGAVSPAIVVLIMAYYGWRAPFLCFGCLGILWAAAWYWYYRDTPAEHRSVNAAERDLIQSSVRATRSGQDRSVPWRRILSSRQMWLISAMYFCYTYGISIYLVWFPKYLNDHRGFGLRQMGFYASLPLLAGTVGDVAGGWISDLRSRRSGDLKTARRTVAVAGFLGATLCIVLACLTANSLLSVLYSCLGVFSMELTVRVSWAITLDIGGDFAGSVSSVMNTCGNLGGATAAVLSGYLVQLYSWDVVFLVVAALCGVAALLSLSINASKPLLT